ncbi:GTPase [Aureococcus anophagefferens]|nr:GTPase [Aureococcus anophagefferens]
MAAFEDFPDRPMPLVESSLLNFLNGKQRGFKVGPSVSRCTRGVWIYGKPKTVTLGDGSTCAVVLLDTEGVRGLEADAQYDTRIFAALMSRGLVYNSLGSIDENAIGQLSFVAQLSKHLVDERGDAITSDEYLEQALKPQRGYEASVLERNRVRHMLTAFFARRCATLVRPSPTRKLQQIDELDASELRPEFARGMGTPRLALRTESVKPKAIDGSPLAARRRVAGASASDVDLTANLEQTWTELRRRYNAAAVGPAKARSALDFVAAKWPASAHELVRRLEQRHESAVREEHDRLVGVKAQLAELEGTMAARGRMLEDCQATLISTQFEKAPRGAAGPSPTQIQRQRAGQQVITADSFRNPKKELLQLYGALQKAIKAEDNDKARDLLVACAAVPRVSRRVLADIQASSSRSLGVAKFVARLGRKHPDEAVAAARTSRGAGETPASPAPRRRRRRRGPPPRGRRRRRPPRRVVDCRPDARNLVTGELRAFFSTARPRRRRSDASAEAEWDGS